MTSIQPQLRDLTPEILIPRLTLLVLLLTAGSDKWRMAAALAVVIVAIPRPRLYTDARFWLAVGGVMAAWNVLQWYAIDNHTFLANYWYLALGMSLLSRAPPAAMAANATALVGVVFAFAVLWKVISPDFPSGNFFEFTLLTDERFEIPARLAGVAEGDLASNRSLLAADVSGTLISGPRLPLVSAVLTWSTLIVESLVAVAFLVPALHRLRYPALIAFAVPTYAMVPVAGFGATLFALAAATAGTDKARAGFTAGFAIIVLWSLLWVALWG